MATKLLYLEDFDVLECQAQIENVYTLEDGRSVVVIDQTCFYPRGGGQDWDTGIIVDDQNDSFAVEEVRLDENEVVHHIGSFKAKPLEINTKMKAVVNKERRNQNTRLHSAGHVIDMAMSELKPDLIPVRGGHYPHMCFVEYEGPIDDAEDLKPKLQNAVNEILKKNITNTLKFVDKEELKKLCRHVPENIPTNKPTRVVLYGDFGVPCGGTHVTKIKGIGEVEITKIKSKKGLTKVSYRVEGLN